MKKLFALLLVAGFVSFTACEPKKTETADQDTITVAPAEDEVVIEEADTTVDADTTAADTTATVQ